MCKLFLVLRVVFGWGFFGFVFFKIIVIEKPSIQQKEDTLYNMSLHLFWIWKKNRLFLMLQNFPIQLYGSTQPSVIFVLKVQMWSESFLLCLRWGEENGLRNREMCSFIVYSMVLRRSLWLWVILPSVWISMPDCVCVRVNYYTLFPESLIWFDLETLFLGK